MERKIGEIFEYNGEWYQCVIGYSCNDCAFNNDSCEERERITFKNQLTKEQITGLCISKLRSDKKPVIFKKLEKVGEPYNTTFVDKTVQNYLLETAVSVPPKDVFTLINNEQRLIAIEIKQNKEDMEGRELDPHMAKVIDEATRKLGEEIGRQIEENINKQRMKPFNLEAAKAGNPVCTRDGRKARIICFDLKNDEYPIVAAVENDSSETLFSYTTNGEIADGIESDKDLMMLPEKKEGWVNIYKEGIDQYIYNNEKAALSRRGSDCIATMVLRDLV